MQVNGQDIRTAKEIREDYCSNTPCYEPSEMLSVLNALVKVTGEVAAQLADMNHNLTAEGVCVTAGNWPLNVKVTE